MVAAVKIARRYNLTVAASGGRHWVINAKSAAAGLTVDLSQMRGVVADPAQHTAVVQGKQVSLQVQCLLTVALYYRDKATRHICCLGALSPH